MRILFVTPFLPYPPDADGTRLIIWNLAAEMSKRHELSLLALTDGNESQDALHSVETFFKSVSLICLRDGFVNRASALLRSFITTYPAGIEKFYSTEMKKRVSELARSGRFDVIHVDMYAMSQYIAQETEPCWIMSLHDSRSLTLQERLRYSRGVGTVKRLLLQRDVRLTQHYESTQYTGYSRCIVVSEQDQEHLLRLNPSLKTVVIRNGVSIYEQEWNAPTEPHAIAFVGDMGYFPNEDAVLVFVREILPTIRSKIPDVKFYAVGRNPTRRVMHLGQSGQGILVTGEVPNVREYIRRCAVAVVPIRYGSGVRNKILDALAVGRPVVAFDSACSGLTGGYEKVIFCASSNSEMAEHVVKLLQTPVSSREIGLRARAFVEKYHSWHQAAELYEQVYRGVRL